MRPRATRLAFLLAALLGTAGILGLRRAHAGEPAPTVSEAARKEAVERLERDVRKMANSPRVAEKKDEIRKDLESLAVLGGADGAKASLEALAFDDEDVEQDVIKIVETVHTKPLVAPLAALIEHKDYRRRFRLHAAMAHAFAVIADVTCIEPLVQLIASEDPKVVAAAADALVTFKQAPHAKRVEAVKKMLEVYESTYNLKMSRRPEDKIQTDQAKAQWEVYGMALRRGLQSLTSQTQLAKPKDFRDWWNDHKKDASW